MNIAKNFLMPYSPTITLDRRKYKKILNAMVRVWKSNKPPKSITVLKRLFKQYAEFFVNDDGWMINFTKPNYIYDQFISITTYSAKVVLNAMTDLEQNELAEINPVFYRFCRNPTLEMRLKFD